MLESKRENNALFCSDTTLDSDFCSRFDFNIHLMRLHVFMYVCVWLYAFSRTARGNNHVYAITWKRAISLQGGRNQNLKIRYLCKRLHHHCNPWQIFALWFHQSFNEIVCIYVPVNTLLFPPTFRKEPTVLVCIHKYIQSHCWDDFPVEDLIGNGIFYTKCKLLHLKQLQGNPLRNGSPNRY